MALESEPVVGVAGLRQIHPRQRNKTKYHIKSGHQKQCAARCYTEQKKYVFSLDKSKRMVTLEMLLKCLNAGNVIGSHDGEKSWQFTTRILPKCCVNRIHCSVSCQHK
jgi:hypothetical protein